MWFPGQGCSRAAEKKIVREQNFFQSKLSDEAQLSDSHPSAKYERRKHEVGPPADHGQGAETSGNGTGSYFPVVFPVVLKQKKKFVLYNQEVQGGVGAGRCRRCREV